MHSGLIQQLSSAVVPQESVIKALFYIIAGLTVFFALRVVTARDIFHGAVYLAMTLIGVACIYLYLDAEFLAVAQILIYVGAIVTLFIFAIMLTANIHDRSIRQANKQVLISAVSALAFLLFIINMIKGNFRETLNPVKGALSITQLGTSLMTDYTLPFEAISLILVAVLVGAIVIAKADKR